MNKRNLKFLTIIIIGALSALVFLEQGCTKNDTNTLKDVDGNVYMTVKIGNQVWTVDNIRTTRFNNRKPIPFVKDSTAWETFTKPAYCFCNNTTNSDSIRKYGALYNWYAVNTGKLAPKGWHVPTDAEWDTLQNYLIANGYSPGKALAAKTDWPYAAEAGAVGNDLTINNSSGFSAIPGGIRHESGRYCYQSVSACWWSATAANESYAWYHYLSVISDHLYRDYGYGTNSCGMSVRLVRDD